MHESLTSDRSGAFRSSLSARRAFAAWLDAQPHSREWLSRTGFKAEPGTFAFMPGSDGSPSRLLPHPPKLRRFSRSPVCRLRCPRASMSLQLGQEESADDAALGWALGSYAFTAYREAKRAPATLVWPADADRAEVERISRSVFLARDMINTPAEDMGPEHLAAAARQWPMRMVRQLASLSATNCCSKTIRRSTSWAARATARPAHRFALGEGRRRRRSRWSAKACASIRAASTSRPMTGCCK